VTNEPAHPEAPAFVLPEDALPSARPHRPNAHTFYLGGLFILALLACCYAAGEIVMPIALAFMLKLVFQPLMRGMQKIRIHRAVASFLIILLLLGSVAGIATILSGPASTWAQEISDDLPRIKQKMRFIGKPMTPIKEALENADELTGTTPEPKTMTVTMEGSRFSDKFILGTKNFMTSTFETLLVLFFLMASGDTFLRRLVEILPRFQDKKQAVHISNQIEKDISGYLITITMMNAVVGIATAAIMLACGLPDPVLWGIAAFLLNYIPVVGPIIVLALLTFVGLTAEGDLVQAMLPAGLFLVVHIIEGEGITPFLLAKRFTLNPVLVILSLVFWYWMWGIPGALLATPMLAIMKIICDRIDSMKPLGHFIEG
jgi:predicted PurR-regulated permease PerM